MTGGGGRAYDGFDGPQIRRPMSVAQLCQKRLYGWITAMQNEAHDAAEAARHLPLGNLVLGVRWEPGIKHAVDGGVLLQIGRDPHGAGVLPLHTNLQRLHAANQQVRREGIERGAGDLTEMKNGLNQFLRAANDSV